MTKPNPITKSSSIPTTTMISLFAYFIISLGVALQIAGGNWDIIWHGIGNVETFFTPPHSVIYSGVALVIFGILFRSVSVIILRIKRSNNMSNLSKLPSFLPFPFKLCVIGAILQLTAGPFDFWWHSIFGFDGLLSPPHTVLLTGMLVASLGGLVGIYKHFKENLFSNVARTFFVISSGIYLMVAVGLVLMFTLPFSEGQYFDFNPEPLAAMVVATTVIPFIMGLSLYMMLAGTKIPFIFTSITGVIITIQATTTILSNSSFMWLFPFYILNIVPPIVADTIVIRHRKTKINKQDSGDKEENGEDNMKIKSTADSNKIEIYASMLVSSFFVFLFFPWTVDVFAGFFQPSDNVRTEEFLMQILLPIILPFVIPVSLISSLIGIHLIRRINKKSLVKMIRSYF
ncbi:MAG: hypothetical protein L0H53_09795 [Candidatus Nitrosocosmicus sp.]|nr:hypothetical protein [Candidatus Nitrosocosmicus sp.]MDN5867953.1 hypothetical protein [Candidatus Nitrosocosmicus sp.]